MKTLYLTQCAGGLPSFYKWMGGIMFFCPLFKKLQKLTCMRLDPRGPRVVIYWENTCCLIRGY